VLQHAQDKKRWKRQAQHRKERPLYVRKKSAAKLRVERALRKVRGQAAKTTGAKFKKQQEAGRPRSTIRGRGYMVRGPGKGGLRPPRTNQHLPAAAAAAAPAQQQGQQQGRSSRRRQQQPGAPGSQLQSQQQEDSQATQPQRPQRLAAARQRELVGQLVQGGLEETGVEEHQKQTKKTKTK
jgi:hypothetical protein